LELNNSIQELNLGNNELGDNAFINTYIEDALKNNSSIQKMLLHNNNLSMNEIEKIKQNKNIIIDYK